MACNFLRYITLVLDDQHGLRDVKVIKKYAKQLEKRTQRAQRNGRVLSPFLDAQRRMAKLSLQYIRCFRCHFFSKSPPMVYLPAFSKALFSYL